MLRRRFILHYIYRDKFTSGYINFMKIYMKSWNHVFITTSSREYPLNTINQDDVIVINNCDQLLFDSKVLDLVYECDQFIVSGIFTMNHVFRAFNEFVLKKVYLHFWGLDFYAYRDVCRRDVLQAKHYMRNTIERCRGVIVLIKEDYDELRKVFYISKKRFVASMPEDPLNTIDLDKYTGDKDKNVCGKSIRKILVGNSATKTNQHAEVYNVLKEVDLRQVEIYSSLSYGDEKYRKEVIAEGVSCFGKKFKPVTELMDRQAYLSYLNMMDVGIFNNNRQQALGNIFYLLDMGKKVYIRKDIPTWKLLKRLGYKIFDVEELKNETIRQIFEFSAKDRKYNRSLGKRLRLQSFDKCRDMWEKVFQDADFYSGSRVDAIDYLRKMIPNQDKESECILKCMSLCRVPEIMNMSAGADIIRVMEGHTPTVLPNLSTIDIPTSALKKKFIIFGTGKHGDNCYKFFEQMHLQNRIKCFWDNDGKKQKNLFHDIFVEAPNGGYLLDGIVIIIASVEFMDEMWEQVKGFGYRQDQMYTFRGILQRIYNNFIEENYPAAFLQLMHRNYTNYNKCDC